MKHPFLHALAAVAYIVLVASVIYYVPHAIEESHPVFALTAFLSLFTFSAAVMAYLFFWRPAELLLAGEGREAGAFFLKTLAAFGILALLLGSILVYLSHGY